MSTAPEITPYVRPAPTKEPLEYADLAAIDVSRVADWSDPNDPGKPGLVKDLKHAIEELGFLYVIGHGIDDLDIRRQLALGEPGLNATTLRSTDSSALLRRRVLQWAEPREEAREALRL